MAAATSVIAASHPDLLLLDIRLRGATAFDLLRELEESPLVIFTTAYDEFALEAFQVASVDYLLKPVDSEGLGRALEKVRRYHSGQRQADLLERVQRLVERSTPAAAEGFLRRLGIRIGDRTLVLPIEEVTHFYAQDKLVYAATTAAKSHIVDSTLVQLARRLDPQHSSSASIGPRWSTSATCARSSAGSGAVTASCSEMERRSLPAAKWRPTCASSCPSSALATGNAARIRPSKVLSPVGGTTQAMLVVSSRGLNEADRRKTP